MCDPLITGGLCKRKIFNTSTDRSITNDDVDHIGIHININFKQRYLNSHDYYWNQPVQNESSYI